MNHPEEVKAIMGRPKVTMDRLLNLLEADCVDTAETAIGDGRLFEISATFNREEARRLIEQYTRELREALEDALPFLADNIHGISSTLTRRKVEALLAKEKVTA